MYNKHEPIHKHIEYITNVLLLLLVKILLNFIHYFLVLYGLVQSFFTKVIISYLAVAHSMCIMPLDLGMIVKYLCFSFVWNLYVTALKPSVFVSYIPTDFPHGEFAVYYALYHIFPLF